MDPIKVSFPGNMKVDVEAGQFHIPTDQCREDGGQETAPEPFTLFLASIASCAGIYAKSFCDVRKIDTAAMGLKLQYFRRENQKRIDRIEMTLHVTRDFPGKYIKPVIKAMNGCTVKIQLHPDIEVETRVMYPEN